MQRITWGTDTPSDEIYYLTNFEIGGDYSYPAHDHENHWELVYCAEGELIHTGPELKLIQQSGELILIRDRDAHSLRCRRTRYTNLAFRAEWLRKIAAASGYEALVTTLETLPDPPQRVIPPNERPALEKSFRELLELTGTTIGRARFNALLLQLIAPFLTSPGRSNAEAITPWLRELITWTESSEPLPALSEIQRRSGYTAEHLCRSFRRFLGISPGAWLKRLRLERACALLRHSNLPVGRIAETVGFQSPQAFHRVFRQSFGTSPAAYRRNFGSPYLQ